MVNRLIGQSFASYSPQGFYDFVKGLMKTSPNASKEVSGISITQKAGKTTIRMNKTDKTLTRDEVSKLATEYKLNEQEFLILLSKRKIGILYELNDSRAEEDRNTQANAKGRKTGRRKISAGNELLKPSDNSRMHEES
jgi:hypothetical protein